jgi:hypothetical protein
MESNGFFRDQYLALREEIKGIQARLFWTVILGFLGVPMLTLVASAAGNPAILLVPIAVPALLVLFLAQQTHMMRAGRFIREHLEQHLAAEPGWEAWLESRQEFRLMDKHFTACFVVTFFVYYVTTIGLAVQRLLDEAATDASGLFKLWLYAFCAVYAVGAVWAISTLVHHWRSSVSTSAKLPG